MSARDSERHTSGPRAKMNYIAPQHNSIVETARTRLAEL
jgi:hypothetical protein